MRRRGLLGSGLAFGALAALSGAAAAQGDGVVAEAPAVEVGATALPGGDHVGYAESLPAGTVSTAFTAGYGYRSGLLASGHTMSRGAATAALAYSIADFLSASLVLDGRYDKHTGTGFDDDGWVGEPRLHLRAGTVRGAVAFGAELSVWMPGKDAPSLVPSATTVDARALVSTRLASGLRLAATAGFRLDNSAESVENRMDLSPADQASLGVSDWNAVVGGIRVAYPAGVLTIGVEGQLDAYVGGPEGRPSPSVAIGAGVSYRLNRHLTAELFVAANIQDKPEVAADNTIPLIPYAPLIGGGIALQARFGGPSPARRDPDGATVGTCDDPDPAKRPADCGTDAAKPELAVLAGAVTDDTGGPVAGAKVTVTDCDGTSTSVTTGADGRYRVERLKPCASTIAIEAPGKIAQSASVALAAGDNTAPDTSLPPMVKPGRFQFVIRSFSTGKGVAAEIEINPGGTKIAAAADGSTELELAPGTYTLRITSPGLKEQTREYVVTENNNVIVNVDLRK
jgi:hypothetical protein